MRVEALTPHIGSLVHGIDLSVPDIRERHGAQLKELFLERQVLFFRDQELSPAAQVRFSTIFGDVPPAGETALDAHPEDNRVCLLESRGVKTQATDVWHADLTWYERPPLGACLHAKVVPDVGGDTLFASMTAAYDSLEPKMQEYLEGLSAVHNWEAPELVSSILARADGVERYRKRRQTHLPVLKPVVMTHPETGRKVLYVSTLYTKEIRGLRSSESAALLAFLTGLAQVPEWQVRFRWQPGSVAVWDNRSTQHYAVNDYHPAHRLMHRVSISEPT